VRVAGLNSADLGERGFASGTSSYDSFQASFEQNRTAHYLRDPNYGTSQESFEQKCIAPNLRDLMPQQLSKIIRANPHRTYLRDRILWH